MREEILDKFMSLDFNKEESEIYFSLLEKGPLTVAEIAEATSIKRTTLYPIIDNMIKSGRLVKMIQYKKRLIGAQDPKIILANAKERTDQFASIVPYLSAIKSSPKRGTVEFYESEEGFKNIWRILFASGCTEYLIITDPRQMLHFVRKNYITGKIIQEKIKRGIRSRQLVSFSEYAKEIVKKDKDENRISKILPAGMPLYYTKIIFGNHIALISPFPEDILFIIESKSLAESERTMFEVVWSSLK